ncbi:transposase [Streptomyces microflavus]|uniref:Transposase n=1 Tax=Streptomyces microflavus TaxID=1919 RepID=A0ABV1QBJ4_STRMI
MGYPRFKKKGRAKDSFRLHHAVTQPTIRLDGYRRLSLPRPGSIRIHDSGKRLARLITRGQAVVQSVTVSRSAHRWYAAVLVKVHQNLPDQPTRAQRANGTVGVDLGVKTLAALTQPVTLPGAPETLMVPNPRHLAADTRRLTRAQRALSRTTKGSARHRKAAQRVATLHHRIAERRSTYLHTLTKQLTTRYATVSWRGALFEVRGIRRGSGCRAEGIGRYLAVFVQGACSLARRANRTCWRGFAPHLGILQVDMTFRRKAVTHCGHAGPGARAPMRGAAGLSRTDPGQPGALRDNERSPMTIDETVQAQDGAPEGPGAYVASPEAAVRTQHAFKDLEALGITVEPKAHWWGFELRLNQEAVDRYLELKDHLADALGEILKEPLSSLVAVAALAQKFWVQAVSRGYGCKLVSPWFSPLMLIPVGLGPKEDLNLWWTVFKPAQGWSTDERFPGHESGSNPALAEFSGKLICVHRGGGDNQLWFTTYDPDKGWTQDTKVGAHETANGPALAVYGGKLHCVHRGSSDTSLWHTTYDGTRWTADVKLTAHESSTGPALAVFGGKLHLVHKGGRDNRLWHATYNGSSWTGDSPLPGHETVSNPALAVYDNKLHLLHRGGNDTQLWHATYNGSSWSDDRKLGSHESLEGPALAVYGGELYAIHRGYGSGDQSLWWTKYRTGGTWTPDEEFPGHESGAGPAAIVYRDKNGTEDQLLVVHRGWSNNRAAGADTAEDEARIAAEQATATTPGTP